MQIPVLAMVKVSVCLSVSVRRSVCLTPHATPSKRRKLVSRSLYCQLPGRLHLQNLVIPIDGVK